MGRSISKKAKPWEKFLMVLVEKRKATKEEILDQMQYEFGDRTSAFAWNAKLAGGVIKVVKDGKKVVSYELVNIKDMEKYLQNRGLLKKEAKKVESLDELKTEVKEVENV